MQITTAELAARVLRLCGQTGAPGRGNSSEEVTEITNFANQLLDGWSAMTSKIFTVSINRYSLALSQPYYTIGPSGADFTATRPISILSANIVLTTASPEVRIPLEVVDDNEWADISVRNYGTNVPTYLYYTKNEMGNALGKLYLVGYPTQANDLELFTPGAFDNALTTSSTIIVPEGYVDALVMTLTEKSALLYWKKSNSALAEIKDQARRARAAIVAANAPAGPQASDAPSGSSNGNRGPYYNYLSGDARPR